jgi:hypothetical protein
MNSPTPLTSVDVYVRSSHTGHMPLTPQTYPSSVLWAVVRCVLLGVGRKIGYLKSQQEAFFILVKVSKVKY